MVNKAYVDTPYFGAGRASELEEADRRWYRFFEMIPGLLSWGTIAGIILLAKFTPVFAAIFIIAFDVYWFLKTTYLSIHLRHNWKRVKHALSEDWQAKLSHVKHSHLYHMVMLPYFTEGEDIIRKTLDAILEARYNHKKIIIVLASEERAGKEAVSVGEKIKEEYKDKFGFIDLSIHPKDLPGEMPGKGSNIAFAAEHARKSILDPNSLKYEDVIVSAFDIDTVVYPDYFACLSFYYATEANPEKVSFQPVPFYHNNIWYAPAASRVAAVSSTFWQMIQQERPENLVTFSSHAVSFKSLHEIGYWQKNVVSEDSRIFWNLFVAHDGDYRVVPISYPVSMDANLDTSFFKTLKNIYKQHRRWMYGAENVPYILFQFMKNKAIPFRKRLRFALVQIEGYWSLATNPIIIFLLGWLPVFLGGQIFNQSILSYNLPIITRNVMTVTMLGLILSAIIAYSLLPPRPDNKSSRHISAMFLQWFLVPITITIFGSIPGLDAQSRLMFGKYMGFWVTPKHRK